MHGLATALAHRGPKESLGTEGAVGLAIRSADGAVASDPEGAVAVVDGPPVVADEAVRRYAESGLAGLATLTGRFALALYDPHQNMLVLARDAVGTAPLYYAEREGTVVFASEPAALLAVGVVEAAPDEQTVRRFIVSGRTDDGEATFFAGIRQVLPGHAVTVGTAGSPRTRWPSRRPSRCRSTSRSAR